MADRATAVDPGQPTVLHNCCIHLQPTATTCTLKLPVKRTVVKRTPTPCPRRTSCASKWPMGSRHVPRVPPRDLVVVSPWSRILTRCTSDGPGQMMDLTVGSDSDFTDVKTLIWQRTGYPVDSQVLLYAISVSPLCPAADAPRQPPCADLMTTQHEPIQPSVHMWAAVLPVLLFRRDVT